MTALLAPAYALQHPEIPGFLQKRLIAYIGRAQLAIILIAV
jgi:hypothetical protein